METVNDWFRNSTQVVKLYRYSLGQYKDNTRTGVVDHFDEYMVVVLLAKLMIKVTFQETI